MLTCTSILDQIVPFLYALNSIGDLERAPQRQSSDELLQKTKGLRELSLYFTLLNEIGIVLWDRILLTKP